MTEGDVLRLIILCAIAVGPSLAAVYHLGNRITKMETKLDLLLNVCPNMSRRDNIKNIQDCE